MKFNKDITTGNPLLLFFYHTIPWVIGMVTISSAGVVDAAFVGNYVGADGLAAVNIAIPVLSFVFGVSIMIAAGGAVRCGKYKGEEQQGKANAIFTKSLIAVTFVSTILSIAGLLFEKPLVAALGANEELTQMVSTYVKTFFYFIPPLSIGVALSYFIRIDNQPVLASASLILCSLSNMFMDWLFVGQMELGVYGAALATGLSYIVLLLILMIHFFRKVATLKLTRELGEWQETLQAALNGISEFINESSSGIITLIFNWVMIKRLGVPGVAAFTVINYIMFSGMMMVYGISDSLQPLISTNFGAKKPKRIKAFLTIAVATSLLSGVVLIGLLLVIPEQVINIFLDDKSDSVVEIALQFIHYFWPVFLINGTNVILSAYFTSMHKAKESGSISLLRSLILPLILLLTLPKLWGDAGIYTAIPIAEGITFIVALTLFWNNRPGKLTAELRATESAS